EIPCFQNSSSEISSEFTYAWSVEDNGTQETLISQNHLISNSTLLKDRIKLGTDYRLHLSPVQIFDDGRKFSCHIRVGPNKILRSSTTVKVFGKGFCSTDSLASSCLLPCSFLKRKHPIMLQSSHMWVTVLESVSLDTCHSCWAGG
ncbi:CD96 isoform 5, partial [Pan troglodytes]